MKQQASSRRLLSLLLLILEIKDKIFWGRWEAKAQENATPGPVARSSTYLSKTDTEGTGSGPPVPGGPHPPGAGILSAVIKSVGVGVA